MRHLGMFETVPLREGLLFHPENNPACFNTRQTRSAGDDRLRNQMSQRGEGTLLFFVIQLRVPNHFLK